MLARAVAYWSPAAATESMAYDEFTFDEVLRRFRLTLDEQTDLFSATKESAPSELLRTLLDESVPLALAIHTEKARSEMIVAPILIELRRLASPG